MGRKVMLNSLFFDNDHEYVFGMCDLREAFKEAMARGLGFLNGRTLEGVERLAETSKKCGKRVDGFSKCGSRAEYRLVLRCSNGKYFSVYLCGKHFLEEIENARTRLVNSVNDLIDHLKQEVIKSEG